ncbi:hypothetical protein [Streptomyces anulatus]|uniref:hypothetical protein n=1 Tax=Streptomyces anulatus TaxID=1892 RepID=UPI00255C8BB0|nr:hypothetical protein [Streptomyces anulatus]WIY80011.1 hypothetical protein QPM16_33210 [Streptomyces anulatus]
MIRTRVRSAQLSRSRCPVTACSRSAPTAREPRARRVAAEESRASTASAAMRSSSGSTASVKRAGFTPARAVRAAERTGSCSLRSRSRSSSTVATWAGSPERPALPTSSAQAVARSSAAGPRVAARSCSRPSSKGR